MAKKTKSKPATRPIPPPAAAGVKKQPAGTKLPDKTLLLLILALVTITGIVVYYPSLANAFTNWDDPGYLTQNYLIRDWSSKGIGKLFTSEHGFMMGNYHPLTMLSLATEYHAKGLQPYIYHRDSMILHILGSLAVTVFTWLLTRNLSITAICGLLFVIHPMHVESVAWVAGRKDVLFGLFYFLALICYYYYAMAKTNRLLYYCLLLFFFILAVLSKGIAVTLPVSCLLVDYYLKLPRKWNLLIQKIPLFIVSIAFGILSIKAQDTAAAIQHTNYVDRIYFSSYAFLAYIGKFFVPVNLSNFYPYPVKTGGSYDGIWYVYPFVAIALLAAVYYFGRRNRGVVFGFLFYSSAIFLLLQLLPVGTAIIADRYSYIAYFGLFFIFAAIYAKASKGRIALLNSIKPVLPFLIICWMIYLGTVTRARCADWKNTETLWRDQIKKQPTDASAYNNLAFELFKQDKNDEALPLFTRAIQLNPDLELAYSNRGEVYRIKGKYEESLNDLNKAIALKPNDPGPYLSRAILYCVTNKTELAGPDFDMAIKLNPDMAEAYCSRGNYDDMKNNPEAAMADYSKAIGLKPDLDNAYINRAALYLKLKEPDKAMGDIDLFLQLKPESGQGYSTRMEAWAAKKEYKKAMEDAAKAQSYGFGINPKYLEDLKKLAGE